MLLMPGCIKRRYDFHVLLDSYGLMKEGVEIGVHRGEFASHLLRKWPGKYHAVDPWADIDEYREQAKTLSSLGGQGNREQDYQKALEVFQPYKNRVVTHRCRSHECVDSFADWSLDWVFIDGNHEAKFVDQDLRMWHPKLKKGGILAGHDIVCPDVDGGWGKQIQPVVVKFAEEYNRNIYLIPEDGVILPWSYYIIK